MHRVSFAQMSKYEIIVRAERIYTICSALHYCSNAAKSMKNHTVWFCYGEGMQVTFSNCLVTDIYACIYACMRYVQTFGIVVWTHHRFDTSNAWYMISGCVAMQYFSNFISLRKVLYARQAGRILLQFSNINSFPDIFEFLCLNSFRRWTIEFLS